MKHWGSLNEVETEIIRLKELKNVIGVITNGIDGASPEQIISSFYHIEGALDDIAEQLSDKFYQLFDEVREDKS
jgi:hypothetical protein